MTLSERFLASDSFKSKWLSTKPLIFGSGDQSRPPQVPMGTLEKVEYFLVSNWDNLMSDLPVCNLRLIRAFKRDNIHQGIKRKHEHKQLTTWKSTEIQTIYDYCTNFKVCPIVRCITLYLCNSIHFLSKHILTT